MKTKFSGILTLLLAFTVQIAFAQSSVSGTVSDAAGPLLGANVIVKGTNNGTQTDFDGNFTLSNVNATDVLVISYVGYTTQEVPVGNQTTFTITLEADSLEEVVITAQGIKREKKALGYSIATVSGDDLEQKPEQDVTRALLGKASGVQIVQTSGVAGSGTNVVIRNYSSIGGNNQALYIVDGVPFSNDTNSQGGAFVGNNGSSRSLDLDPNNVESVSVLKGLAAATLYGSAGRNGVILITTKTGSRNDSAKKNEITVSQSYFVDEVASLPDYQNEFGNGFDQAFGWFFSNWGPSFQRDGVAGFGSQAAIDDNGTLEHPYSTAAAATGIPQDFPEFAGARYEWRPYNSVERFFRTGGASTTSVSLRGTADNAFYNVSFGHLDQTGFTPGNIVRRTNLSVGGGANLTNKFDIAANLNFSRTDFRTPPVAESEGNGTFSAGTSSVFGHLFFTPRSVDLIGLPFQSPVDGRSVYYRQNNSIQHPLWTVANARVSNLTHRVQGSAVLTYNFNDNLNVFYRAGIDVFNTLRENYQNRGGIDANVTGFLNTDNILNQIYDHSIVVNGDYDLSKKIGLTFNVGATSRSENTRLVGVASTGQAVFDIQRHFNFANNNEIEFRGTQNIVGIYGQVAADYDNWAFLTLAGRNDWASNLEEANRSLFYPSASLSLIPTQFIPNLKSDKWGLNYLKLRAGIGTSARFPGAGTFPTSQTLAFNIQAFQDTSPGGTGNDIAANSASNTIANPDLQPELQTEFEVGFESKFLDNRVSLDASYFDRTTRDLIVGSPLPPSSGVTNSTVNVGEIQGDGIEADLGIDFFREGKFTWNLRVNYTSSESVVTDLGTDVDQIIFAGNGGRQGGNVAREGEVLGAIVGTRIGRDPATGAFLVNAAGNYIIETVDEAGLTPVVGDPNPDFVMNYINTFTWGNWNFGFQVNHTLGGDIVSSTISTLLGRGLTTDTVDRINTFILPGIQQASGQPNTVQINNSDFYFSNVLFGPTELRVYDASVVRLQSVSLGYSFPSKFLDRTPFGSLSITASGQNLWYDAYNTPDGTNFDPNVNNGVGNSRGFEFINGPTGKRWGVSVRATF